MPDEKKLIRVTAAQLHEAVMLPAGMGMEKTLLPQKIKGLEMYLTPLESLLIRIKGEKMLIKNFAAATLE